jgi:translation initiation factor 2 subunit 3
MTSGHVDHGKSTLVHALTGHFPDTHSEEIKRGITIKLGYADAIFRKCPKCPAPTNYTVKDKCPNCGTATEIARQVSFVDAPGHETLMATMVAASSIVDGAIFIVAANEVCPQPQTLEHLLVLQAVGIKNVVIAQTKVDLVTKEQAVANYKQIKDLVKGTPYQDAPIVPISAVTGTNLSALIYTIEQAIPTPVRDNDADPLMYVARSFDINKPGTPVGKLSGGVMGGAIVRGTLREGDEVQILPGILTIKKEKESYKPLTTKIVSLNAGGKVAQAHSGGLIGVGTLLDPAFSRADSLVGSVLGKPGTLPPVITECAAELRPIARTSTKFSEGFVENEALVLGVGTATTVGFASGKAKGVKSKSAYLLKLKKPVCAKAGDVMAVLRRSGNRWHFYGTAKVV